LKDKFLLKLSKLHATETRTVWTGWCSSNRFWTQVSIPLVVSELCHSQSSKSENEQRTITQLGNTELWFFCTALLSNEIYLPTKFHVVISYTFRVMTRTRTGGRTKRRLYVHPSRSIIRRSFKSTIVPRNPCFNSLEMSNMCLMMFK
jgi:hypothetical protein